MHVYRVLRGEGAPSGYTYHFVALEGGVRSNGKLIARDIQRQINTIRSIALQADLRHAAWIISKSGALS